MKEMPSTVAIQTVHHIPYCSYRLWNRLLFVVIRLFTNRNVAESSREALPWRSLRDKLSMMTRPSLFTVTPYQHDMLALVFHPSLDLHAGPLVAINNSSNTPRSSEELISIWPTDARSTISTYEVEDKKRVVSVVLVLCKVSCQHGWNSIFSYHLLLLDCYHRHRVAEKVPKGLWKMKRG